ncbi:MAG TPA: hypothetical protein VF230_16650 [Acidimicrobiales bacterium]
MAMIALLAAFLIPLGTSSLRGLTHVLTCRDEAEIPFTLITPEEGDPVIVSSTTIERGQPEGVCGGLVLDMQVGPAGPGRVELVLPITNRSEFDWRGTVRLKLGATTIPVDIGQIKHSSTESDTVTINVRPGEVELHGSLLLGP